MTGTLAGQLRGSVRVGITVSEFGSWMTSEQRRIFLLCRRMLQDADEADSATQDAFLKAYRSISKTPSNAAELDHPEKWITRIAVNTCLDRLRSRAWRIWQRRPPAADEQVILEMREDTQPDAERQVLSAQIQRRIEAALAKLSARQRAVFTLRHYDALPLEDIGDVLDLDTGTVKAHLFRALGKLREELKDLYLTEAVAPAGLPKSVENPERDDFGGARRTL
jgi:RNA polymerase sigma-70 factor, ECF subfamily